MVKTALVSCRSLIPMLGLAACLAFGGCASTPEVSTADPTTPEASGKPVVLLDEDMGHYVAVDNVISTRNAEGYLVVQANIRSRSENDFSIQAQTLFYDANGIILNSSPGNEAPWTNLTLAANSTVPYSVQSLTTTAKKFTIRLRYVGRQTY